jgi:selenocysteine lyase/cysteine desulfurase
MGVDNITQREAEITDYVMNELEKNDQVVMLEPHIRERLSIVSFYVRGAHYNLIVRLLNDKFGVQTRGGCSCAGTYGHILLNVNHDQSQEITKQIDAGDYCEKPGWVRASFHPTMTNSELSYVVESINAITSNIESWSKEYRFNPATGDFVKQGVNSDELISLEGFVPITAITTVAKDGQKNESLFKRLFK